MKKFFKGCSKVSSLLTTVVIIVALIGAVTCILPQVFGVTVGVVTSGSMEPNIKTGSLCYVVDTEAESVEVGDVITFKIGKDMLVTHRVISHDEDAQTFITKGDNNDNADISPVSYDMVVGKTVFSLAYLGYVYSWWLERKVLIISVMFIIVAVDMFIKHLAEDDDEGKAEKEKEVLSEKADVEVIDGEIAE